MGSTNTVRMEESDSLASLEERIIRAVQLVSQLRQDKEAMQKLLSSAEGTIADLKTQNAQLGAEVDALQSERKQVRGRIEKLLGQMDLLSAS